MTQQPSVENRGGTIEVATFFWEGAHTMSQERFHRAQHIHDLMTEEFCCDRGLVMELVLTELSDEELQVLEKVLRRCQEARKVEAEVETTAEDRALEGFADAAS